MKKLILFPVLLLHAVLFGQDLNTIDSLASKICQSANKNKNPSDTVRIDEAIEKHFSPYLEKLAEKDRKEHYKAMILRLQVTCQLFSDLLSRNDKDPTFKPISICPESKLTKDECEGFWKMDRFSYDEPEAAGRTFITVKDNIWIEDLEEGTYSKLTLKKRPGCEFELIFVQSDHSYKKYLSRPGERYIYRLIEKKSNHYVVCGASTVINKFEIFKLYF